MPKSDRLYALWNGMLSRCYNPHNRSYPFYSKQNITVCEDWRNSFELFKKWALQNGYDYSKSRKEQTLDRIDNSKGYFPSNCRFVSHSENCRNKDNNVLITFQGKTQTAIEWSKELNIPHKTILTRHSKGYPVEKILTHEYCSKVGKLQEKYISFVKGKYMVRYKKHYVGEYETLEQAIIERDKFKNEFDRIKLLHA